MFSDKKNVNILISLLVRHGVRRAVVCPGSRNAPIVHDLNECQDIECYPVTDERSAGFYALGMALFDDNPVVVCVTSGSALLNLMPAVAEASYRHHGLVVISADRPAAWIEQLDGQTLSQVGAFGCHVSKCVTLPEPRDDEEQWYCGRLVNEALIAVRNKGRKSVHINVPLSEPLFNFSESALPDVQTIRLYSSAFDAETFRAMVIDKLLSSDRPMVVIGQISKHDIELERAINVVLSRFVVLSETLSSGVYEPFDMALPLVKDDVDYKPDFVLYLGDTLVSKRLKAYLRDCDGCETWAVSIDGEIHDTFMNQTKVFEGDAVMALKVLAEDIERSREFSVRRDALEENGATFHQRWQSLLSFVRGCLLDFTPRYSQLAVVREFEASLEDMDYEYQTHYANSMSVRLSCIYSDHYVWCNRGVNGIEGSLSTAAGHSLATSDMVFCVTGDLSFFYDQNALWNTKLGGNLRVILLNNGCGGIFYGLPGVTDSAALDKLIAAGHDTDARGVCAQNDIGYLSARDMSGTRLGLATLMTSKTRRPMVLEVFTDKDCDDLAMKELTKYISERWNIENGKP